MFRWIGIAVVAAVLYWGFGAIKNWYYGELTPQEAVGEVKRAVGQKLLDSEHSGSRSSDPKEGGKASNANEAASPNDLLKKMMKE